MSGSSSASAVTGAVTSQTRQPQLGVGARERPEQARADERVVLDVQGAESVIGGVPDLRIDLVAPQVVLELLFLSGALEEQELRPGIADAVAEGGVEAVPDLRSEERR